MSGFDGSECSALTTYTAASASASASASDSSSKSAKSGSVGIGALDQIKTGGKGRMIEAVGSGGRNGLIGGDGIVEGVLGQGHGHEHGQEHLRTHLHLSSVAAPHDSSPVVHSHEYAVLTTTPTTTTNIAHSPYPILSTIPFIRLIFLFPIY